MENFVKFLEINLNETPQALASEERDSSYQPGILAFGLLASIDFAAVDPSFHPRLFYVRNLILKNPTLFNVPLELPAAERALMFLSFNNYRSALAALGLPLQFEFSGAKATSRAGASTTIVVAKLSNTQSREYFDFHTEQYRFPDFRVSPLTHLELLFLYIKLKQLAATEDNATLLKPQIRSILDRALFPSNAFDLPMRRAFHTLQTEYTDLTVETENLLASVLPVNPSLFCSPIVFKSQMEIQIGLAFMRKLDFAAAYSLLQKYPLYNERIECLIVMKKSAEAVADITNYVNRVGVPQNKDDQILLSNLYIKLGHLCQETSYFDRAATIFQSVKPLKIKGLWFFNKQQYKDALHAFEKALKLTPCDEEIRYLCACTLMALERFSEATKILKLLKLENPQNENISKSLSFSYYKLQDVENSLSTLRSIALQDHPSMKQYIYLSIRHNLTGNVVWGLERVNFDIALREVANYLIQSEVLSEMELRAILEKNPNISAEDIVQIMTLEAQ